MVTFFLLICFLSSSISSNNPVSLAFFASNSLPVDFLFLSFSKSSLQITKFELMAV
ncbi:hypothetical protein M951_chr3189 (nucleomorph) [Lotharella oceanica]|uniref:Uncharacterized protein n=1 Tax=Lotharella oceanica TaxID=641309 RepID=A0A060DGU9_9EUKA|nr:hypothetical protein M951_chr116 [Lotharella oceanica]AIB09694.1 hypothetical protein M951_chr1215 [Lotharella oceanica]AIB09719.1 hypothetical protein M951_chr216 [Lotharella oceanica]AIB09897.1 hypothetical protein M951_chr2205 [Lotharella oceanica]AIB09922.1 hypothetical protein M951_chr316 [Lotharella oceanica]